MTKTAVGHKIKETTMLPFWRCQRHRAGIEKEGQLNKSPQRSRVVGSSHERLNSEAETCGRIKASWREGQT